MKTSIAERPAPLWWIRRQISWELHGTGYVFRCFGSNSVGVQGDTRVVGPTVILKPPANSTTRDWGAFGTGLINRVKGVTRVLVEFPR